MSKWTCTRCKSINAQFAPRCHNCGTTPASRLSEMNDAPKSEMVAMAVGAFFSMLKRDVGLTNDEIMRTFEPDRLKQLLEILDGEQQEGRE